MDTDAILTFQAPGREPVRVLCTPSPALELAYAVHYLIVRLAHLDAGQHEVGWVAPLLEAERDLVQSLRAFGPDHEIGEIGPALLVLAARYGYVRDGAPDRFLRDLPTLPGRYVEDGVDAAGERAQDEEGAAREATFRTTMVRLEDPSLAGDLRDLVARLWQALAPAWQRDGRAAVQRAADEFAEAFDRSGSVLAALPQHHFTRFEQTAHSIREGEQRGRVVVVPLYFASTGGFNFQIDDGHYVGYGLQSETIFERTAARVGTLAGRVKTLGDPTRLMALTLVGRFASLRLTVGDLAEHIGVSQPTLSGHLKLLREAGLVSVERRGNKSYYALERESVRQLLRDLDEALLD
jgi:DNA-binding transcriptional ArsR family regulator